MADDVVGGRMTTGPGPYSMKMALLLESKLQLGDPVLFYDWLRKQPTRQLLKVLFARIVFSPSSRPSTHFPHVFAVVQLLSEKGNTDVEQCFESIIKMYVQAGCNVNSICDDFPPSTRSRKGFTPLLLAIDQRKPLVAKVLIKLGADVNISDSAGFSPLHWAALTSSNVDLMKCLLEAGAKIKDDQDENNATCMERPRPVLHIAVDEGRVEIVNYLLGIGVDVNTSAKYKVLEEKCWCKITSRYDCGLLDQYREDLAISAVGRAVRMRKLDVLNVLLRNPEAQVSLTDLHYCILEGDCQTANMIIHKVNKIALAQDKIQGTNTYTLHHLGKRAFQNDHIEDTVKLLETYLKSGFDINAISHVSMIATTGLPTSLQNNNNVQKRTLLFYALTVVPLNLTLLKFLVKNGANPFLPLERDVNPFQTAFAMNNLGAIQIFLHNEIDILTRMKEFAYVLMMNVDDKLSLLEFVKQFVPPVRLAVPHFFLSLRSLNELLVEFVLANIPQSHSLFTIQNYWKWGHKTFCGSGKTAHWLEDFVEQVLESSRVPNGMDVSLQSLVKVINGFRERGYELREKIPNPLTSVVVNATIRHSSFRDEPFILYNDLPLFPHINWSPLTPERSQAPLNIALCEVSHCIGFNHFFRQPRLPLWTDDSANRHERKCSLLQLHRHSTVHHPAFNRFRCFDLQSFQRSIRILEDLLDKGVSASHVQLTNLLKNHQCLIRCLPIIKQLWWAGGKLNFEELETLYDNETLIELGNQKLLDEFLDWIEKGKQNKISLQRIVSIRIRDSLKYHDLDDLGCSVLPLKKMKELLLYPTYISTY